jgi:hypothetical protein
MYAVGHRQNSTIWVPFGHSSSSSASWILYSDNTLYIRVGSTDRSVSYTGSSAVNILVRVRRNSSNQMYLAATGMAEAAVGAAASGDFISDADGGRVGDGQYTTSGNDVRFKLAYAADHVASGADVAIRAAIVAQFGVTDITGT